MRIDLHNHTITTSKGLPQLKKLERKNSHEAYIQAIKYHQLDGLAITNYHNIEVALNLAKEYPKHVIVGAEYKVYGEAGTSVQVVVLDITPNLHEILMNARLRGLPYFVALIKEHNAPFYMAHVGLGIPLEHAQTLKLLDSYLSYFDAIEVIDAFGIQNTHFAHSIALYYNLATIGGSGHLVTESGRRAYTECESSKDIREFFDAIRQKNVKVGLTQGASIQKSGLSSLWEFGKESYRREMQKIWHSEFGLTRDANMTEILKNIGEVIVWPALQWLPQIKHLQQLKVSSHKLSLLESQFIDYLKCKETKRIFSLPVSLEEKKKLWGDAILRIHNCFLSHIN